MALEIVGMNVVTRRKLLCNLIEKLRLKEISDFLKLT